jgi:hypothetical protein
LFTYIKFLEIDLKKLTSGYSSFSECCDLDKLGPDRLAQVHLETVDITLPEHENWFNRFRYEIPVFYLDGKFLCKNRIDLDLFDQKLSLWENKM